MLSDVRDHFGLTRGISLISQVAYFETTQLQKLVAELKLAINDSKLIVLAGMVGTGKTATLEKIQDRLEQSKDILVASSLSVDGSQITQASLIVELYCDLATDKDGPMPKQPGLRERALQVLIRKRKKPSNSHFDFSSVGQGHLFHLQLLRGWCGGEAARSRAALTEGLVAALRKRA